MFIIVISCSWVIGIYLGTQFNLPLALISSGLLPIPLIFILKRYRRTLILAAVCLAIIFGAAFYYTDTLPSVNQIVSFNNQGDSVVEGVIQSPPEVKDNITHIELSVSEINGQSVQGKVLVFAPHYPEYHYGDVLSLKGELENPPKIEGFDYQAYLGREGIYSTMLSPQINLLARGAGSQVLDWIYSLRERLSQSLSAALPEPQASLAQGIVLGIRSTIPDSLQNNLSVTGTAHLLAISGINLSIIAGILVTLGIWLFGRRHYIYVWLAIGIIWFYALITGMQAPVIRAAIMASIFLLAELLGRQKNIFAALALSAAIMIGIDPQLLWSISFQLTFLSMVGLIFIAPPIQDLGRRAIYTLMNEEGTGTRTVTAITDSFSISLGAVIAIWPIIAYNFGTISIIGPVSTVLVSPALSFIIFSGLITGIIGIFSVPVAQVIGWVAWLFLSYMIWLINAFAGLPGAAVHTGSIHIILIWIYYSVIGLAICIKSNLKKIARFLSGFPPKISFTFRIAITRTADIFTATPKKYIIIPLLMLACLTCFAASTMPDDNLHISILDVGEGDSTLIQSGNRNILIDGGPSPQSVILGLSSKLPFWNRNLDLVILTHPHLDHLSGLIEVLHRYRVMQVIAPNLTSTSPAYQEWLDLIKAQNIQNIVAQSGQQVSLANGAKLEILSPPDTDPHNSEADLENYGIVSRLTLNKISFLFTADICEEAESRLINQRRVSTCTVLKVAHHGSSTSTTSDFLSVIKPQIAVISVGSDNTFGHPNKEVLKRLTTQKVYRTDLSGTIEFTTDGERLWVKTER